MTAPTADRFLLGGGTPSAFGRDDQVGTTVTGTICQEPEVKQQTSLDGAPLTWDNGDPRWQLVVVIATDLRDPAVADDDGRRALYVKGSAKPGCQSMQDAVAGAVRASGAKGLAVGGHLAVTFVGTEPSATRGFSDRKLWSATYAPPDPTATSGAFLGTADPAPAAQPAPPAPAAPAHAAAPAKPLGEQAKEYLSQGLDVPTVAGMTGLPPATVAALANTLSAPPF